MSCLFNSLAFHTTGSYNATELRKLICDYLEKDPILIEDTKFSKLLSSSTKHQSLQHYVSQMRKPSTWGSAFEVRAFCEIFHVIILVKTPQGRFIEFQPNRRNKNQHLKKIKIDWNGYHYEPIRP